MLQVAARAASKASCSSATRATSSPASSPRSLTDSAPWLQHELQPATVHIITVYHFWIGGWVVTVIDSNAERTGFKSHSIRCLVTVLGKLFTPTVPTCIFLWHFFPGKLNNFNWHNLSFTHRRISQRLRRSSWRGSRRDDDDGTGGGRRPCSGLSPSRSRNDCPQHTNSTRTIQCVSWPTTFNLHD